jgi:hypothetical protein
VAALSSAIGALVLCGCGASSGGASGGGASSDRAVVQRVIESLRSDVAHQQYAAACALLEPRLAARIGAEALGPPHTCAIGLAAASRRAPSVFGELPTGPIQIRGHCGYVPRPCHGTGCAAIAPLTVCQVRSGWRVVVL